METADAIKDFIVAEFLSDVTVDQLDSDYDLLASGVIDSLRLLRLVTWLETRFSLPMDDIEIAPDNFRTVTEIVKLVERSANR